MFDIEVLCVYWPIAIALVLSFLFYTKGNIFLPMQNMLIFSNNSQIWNEIHQVYLDMFILSSFFPLANLEMLRGTVTNILLTNYLHTNNKAYIFATWK